MQGSNKLDTRLLDYCSETLTGERLDIKTELKRQIAKIEAQINEYQESLRVAKAKLKLIEKNSDLEAYLNLDRMR